jgi:CheY-like chemotaxis protein
LGLTIAKELTELMGGWITAESALGEGSTFHFTVRLRSASSSPPSPRPDTTQEYTLPSLAPGGRSRSILVAEDNLVNQTIAVRLLQRQGFAVELAANGHEAVENFGQKPFDAILMDVQMPEMDGFEATVAIRQLEKASGTHIPIIAMTAHAMKGDRERCLSNGMDGYISKPVRPSELFSVIQKVILGHQPA